MVEYKGPIKEFSLEYSSKFIRAGEDLFVVAPNDKDTSHEELAEQDRILEKVQELTDKNSKDVDAGSITVNNKRKSVSVIEGSADLGLPVQDVKGAARRKTVQEFRKQTPGYTVSSH